MTFTDSVHKYKFKNEATSNIKNYQVLSSSFLNDVGIYPRDGPFSSDIGIVNLHPFQGTHWIIYNHECYFDSYGCVLPQKLSKIFIKPNGPCLYSEYKIQCLTSKKDSYCASFLI